jgi:hypothetical protein
VTMSEPPPAKRSLTDTLRPWRSRATVTTGRQPQTKPQTQTQRNFTATLREWHKRAGLFAFVFLGWLGFSGILLNEASDLNLNGIRVGWPWLMAIYGLHAEPPLSGLGAGGHWLAQAGESTVLDGKPLAEAMVSPLGLVAAPEPRQASKLMLYVALADSLVLLRPDGTKVDELRMPPLPIGAIRRVGAVAGHPSSIAIQGSDTAYQSDDEGESWKPVPATAVSWSALQQLPPEQRKPLERYSRPSVSAQQLLVDVHSGRLFGRFGTFVIDAAGLAALILATSGVWMMWRTNNARRKQAQRLVVAQRPPQPQKKQEAQKKPEPRSS